MTNDLPIHLGAEEKVVPVTLWQTHLDGICALIHYCEGVASSGKGFVPGAFELIMHYREIKSCLRAEYLTNTSCGQYRNPGTSTDTGGVSACGALEDGR